MPTSAARWEAGLEYHQTRSFADRQVRSLSPDQRTRARSFTLGSRFLAPRSVATVSENDAGFFVRFRFFAVVRFIAMTSSPPLE